MNRHFQDTRYYLKNAVTAAKDGVKYEVEPVVDRVTARFGTETETEPSRIDELKTELKTVQQRAEENARATVQQYRGPRAD